MNSKYAAISTQDAIATIVASLVIAVLSMPIIADAAARWHWPAALTVVATVLPLLLLASALIAILVRTSDVFVRRWPPKRFSLAGSLLATFTGHYSGNNS